LLVLSQIYNIFHHNCRKKGKKGSKKIESAGKLAVANSKVWEAKLEVAESSKQEYRKNYTSEDELTYLKSQL